MIDDESFSSAERCVESSQTTRTGRFPSRSAMVPHEGGSVHFSGQSPSRKSFHKQVFSSSKWLLSTHVRFNETTTRRRDDEDCIVRHLLCLVVIVVKNAVHVESSDKTSVRSPDSTHVRLLRKKTWEFPTWIQSLNFAEYMALDQDKNNTTNSFPRFRWELRNLDPSSGKFLLYTHPLTSNQYYYIIFDSMCEICI